MKRIILFLLCFVLMLMLVACNDNKASGEKEVVSITFSKHAGDVDVYVIEYSDGSESMLEIPVNNDGGSLDSETCRHEFIDYTPIASGESNSIPCEERFFYAVCANCNLLDWRKGKADDHIYSTLEVKATCTQEGYDLSTCTVCGKTEKSNITKKANHKFDQTVFNYDQNSHWHVCTVCAEVCETQKHTPSTELIENKVEPTCTEDGGYDLVVRCVDCKKTLSNNRIRLGRLEHNRDLVVLEDDYCGERQISSIYCSRCNEYVTSYGHHYVKEVTSATCLSAGREVYTCELCDDSYTVDLPKLDHIRSDYIVIQTPDCENGGVVVKKCIVCDSEVARENLEAKGHVYSSAVDGNVLVHTCFDCNHSYREEISVDLYTVTFTSEGSTVHTLSVKCGETVNFFPNINKSGYTLDGWAFGDSGSLYSGEAIYSDVTLNALWEEQKDIELEKSDTAVFMSVDPSFTFVAIASSENVLKSELKITDMHENSVAYSVSSLGDGRFEISSSAYVANGHYFVSGSDGVAFEGTESKKLHFSIVGDNVANIVIKDGLNALQSKEIYGIVQIEGKHFLLTEREFAVGDTVAVYDGSAIESVIKVLTVDTLMGYNAYTFEFADYGAVFESLEANISGDISGGIVEINPDAKAEIKRQFLESNTYKSARIAAIRFAETYDFNFSTDIIDISVNESGGLVIVEVKYSVPLKDDIEIVVTYRSTIGCNYSSSIKSFENNSVITELVQVHSLDIKVGGKITNDLPDEDAFGNSLSDRYAQMTDRYIQMFKDASEQLETTTFKNTKGFKVVEIYIPVYAGISMKFGLYIEMDFELSGYFGTNIEITTTKTTGVKNGETINSTSTKFTALSVYMHGKLDVTFLGKAEIALVICGMNLYGNIGLGPYITIGGAGSLVFDQTGYKYTKAGVYVDCGMNYEINVGIKLELWGIKLVEYEYGAFSHREPFSSFPLGTTEFIVGFRKDEDRIEISGDCYGTESFKLTEIIDDYVKVQKLADMSFDYKSYENLIYSLMKSSGYTSKTKLDNALDTVTFTRIGDTVELEIKVSVNDITQKIVTVVYIPTHKDNCVHKMCAVGRHTGGNPTCTERAVCEVCELEYGEPRGHSFVDGICSVCGHRAVSEGLEYELLDDGTWAVSGIGTFKENTLVIPSVYVGIAVTAIKEQAFKDCKSIRSIYIGEGVKEIGKSAFRNCTNVTNISISATVETISEYAFYNCVSVAELYFNAENCNMNGTYITYFSYLGSNVLSGTRLIIGKAVKYVPDFAFADQKNNITSLEFEEDSICHTIGRWAFDDSQSLKKIQIPKSVTRIRCDAFAGCTALEEIYYNAEDVTIDYYTSGRTYYSAPFINAGKYSSGIKVTVGKDALTIPAYLFTHYEDSYEQDLSTTPYITSVVFEEGGVCKNIESHAFFNCTNLRELDLGESVEVISEFAFFNCPKIRTLTIPSSVRAIDANAFVNCSGLYELHYNGIGIPNNWAFSVPAGNRPGVKLVIGKTAKNIGTLFANENATIFFVNCGVDDYDFDKLNVTEVVFEDGSVYETVADRAFDGCENISSIHLPDSVTSIGAYAFRGSSLSSITIGKNVKAIGKDAFSGCYNLETVNITDIASWCGISYENYYAQPLIQGCKLNFNGKPLIKITAEDMVGVTSIAANAFYGCNTLVSITLGADLLSIGNDAFFNCTRLFEIVDNSTLGITAGSAEHGGIGGYALDVHSGESKIVKQKDYLFYTLETTNYLIGYVGEESVLDLPSYYNGEEYEICNYAFYANYQITNVIIPTTVKKIGKNAFAYCPFEYIKYRGTQSQWNSLKKDEYWDFKAGNSRGQYSIEYNYTNQ